MQKLIDSHAHLTFSPTADVERLIANAKNANVKKIINICVDQPSLEAGERISLLHDWIYNSAAVSPHDVAKKEAKDFFVLVENAAKAKTLVAIGETGLDYYYHKDTHLLQKEYFQKHIKLAKDNSLPLIIHCRDAFTDLFQVAKKHLPFKAVIHCFTGNLKEAKEALAVGWNISFSGIVTFNKSTDLQDIVKHLPLEQILIETDTPFLSPQKYRGKSNEPAFLIEIATKIAELKNCSVEKVIEKTAENAMSFFSLA